MKKKFLCLLLAVTFIIPTFSSCSSVKRGSYNSGKSQSGNMQTINGAENNLNDDDQPDNTVLGESATKRNHRPSVSKNRNNKKQPNGPKKVPATSGFTFPSNYLIPIKKRYIALTFDDGPGSNFNNLPEDKITTLKLLQILKENHVPATFFLVGKQIEKYPNAAKLIRDDGFLIGSHTYDHANLMDKKIADEKIKFEIGKNDEVFQKYLGFKPTIFRPPYGHITPRIAKFVGRPVIKWSNEPQDYQIHAIKHIYSQDDATEVAERVIHSARDGDIVLLHDKWDSTVNSIPMIIEGLRAEGFEFVTVKELFAIKNIALKPDGIYYSTITSPVKKIKVLKRYYDYSLATFRKI